MDAKMIIEALSSRPRVYPREAVQAAMDQRDEVMPLLLEHLERVVREPEEFIASDEPAPLLLDYALYLLGHHRVREAHRSLVALASLPGELPDLLLGDTITEHLDVLLWKTSGGEPGEIERLAENGSADVWCRTAAIKALAHGVAEKVLARDDVVEFLRGLLARDGALEDAPEVWTEVAGTLADLWPGEAIDILRQGFDEGLILTGFVDPEYVEQALEAGKEAQLAKLEQRSLQVLREDPHKAMAWWASFHPERPGLFGESAKSSTSRGKRADRQKQKQARTTRKKARRKKKGKR